MSDVTNVTTLHDCRRRNVCSHYQILEDADLLLKKFGAPTKVARGKYDMWPRYPGVFIRSPAEHDTDD